MATYPPAGGRGGTYTRPEQQPKAAHSTQPQTGNYVPGTSAQRTGWTANQHGALTPNQNQNAPKPQQQAPQQPQTNYWDTSYWQGGPVPAISPGLTPGVADPNAGLNMMTPGASEVFWGANAGAFTAPTAAGQTYAAFPSGPGMGQMYAQNATGRYAAGTPSVTQFATDAYKGFEGPQLNADMGAYYDNAKRRASEDIRREMAARGMYGSSASGDMVTEAMVDLEAQRARDEAEYGLRRADSLTNAAAVRGELAASADRSSLASSENELAWTKGLADIAFGGEELGLEEWRLRGDLASSADESRILGLREGSLAADRAQSSQRQRGQDFFNNTSAAGVLFGTMAGDTYGDMADADAALLDAMIAMRLGYGAEGLNQTYRNQDRMDEQMWNAYELFAANKDKF